MKTGKPITTLLGITQREAAMLLRVSPSHWSMYESGKRSLPLAATQLLAEMLQHVESHEKMARTAGVELQAERKQIELLLRENEYRQLLLARKMAATVKRQSTQRRLSHLADFLAGLSKKGAPDASHQQVIDRAARTPTENKNAEWLQYQLRMELLDVEKKHLEKKLQDAPVS